MKKVIIVLFLVAVFNVKAYSAESMYALDLDNDIVYYDHNSNEEKLIASVTKIMSAIVTIECVDLEKEVVVGDEVLKAYGSAIYIQKGEKLKLKDLLYGLMLRSGNDAAVVIAKNVAGSMESFVSLMNEMAIKLNLNNTYFYNNHGLEENDGKGNVSTARDLAILTKYAMKNKTFRAIFGTKSYKVKTNYKSYSWINKNKLLHSEDYITGGKTGFTKKARRTLVTTGSRNNINVVVVTLNDGNDFLDHKKMYESIFRNYKAVLVVDKDKLNIKDEKYYKGDKLYLKDSIYVSVKDDKKEKIKVNYDLYKEKYKDKDVVGKVRITKDGKLIREDNIYVQVMKKNEKSMKKSIFGKWSWW